MPSVVIGRSPSEDTGESMFLIPERLLQPNYSTREQCDAFLGRSVGPWAPGPCGERCQTQSSP